jgi:hypothetical protein
MSTRHPPKIRGMSRRKLLQAGLAAGVTLSAWPLSTPTPLWGAEAGTPKRSGILRMRGWDPHTLTPMPIKLSTPRTLLWHYRVATHTIMPASKELPDDDHTTGGPCHA